MRGAGIDEERCAAAIADFQQIAKFQLGSFESSRVEIDSVHRLGEIERDDQWSLVLGKGRLLALPRRSGDSNSAEHDERATMCTGRKRQRRFRETIRWSSRSGSIYRLHRARTSSRMWNER